MAVDLTPRPLDTDNVLLQKICAILAAGGGGGGGGEVTLTVSDIEIGAVELKNGSDDTRATIFSRPNSNPVATQLVDSNGDPVSVGGGTQYAEDTASAAGEQLSMAGVVRKDSPVSLVDADGDRTELQVNSSGALRVDGSGITQPISAISLPLPTGAAQEHTTAVSPNSTRLSDGAAFYDSTKTGQLPAALISGRLDVNVGAAIPAGTNNIGDVDVLTIPAPLSTSGGGTEATALRVTLANDSTGLVSVDDNGSSLTVDGTVNANIKPATSGGFSTFHLVSAGTTNATNLKASAGQVFGWFIYNSNASARKVVFHNTAGTPTAGASVFFSIVIPGLSGANVFNETGIEFTTGIAITTVTGLADSDATAVASEDLIINIWFK